MMKIRFMGILVCLPGVLFLILGCSITPPKSTFEEAIVNHFKNLKYQVLTMHIDSVEEIPLSEKQYMGTPGYIVNLSTLVLEADESSPDKKENQISFNDIKIHIKKSAVENGKWVVTNIIGFDYQK